MRMNFKRKLVASVMGATCCVAGATYNAEAATFNEPLNPLLGAGQTLATALDTSSVGKVTPYTNPKLTAIAGIVGAFTDLYKIQIDGGLFTASTLGGADFNSQLFLFDSVGKFITQNDDAGGTLQSKISTVLTSGTYFLGISRFDYDPVLDGAGVLAGWRGIRPISELDRYKIALGVETIPTPALLPGLLGLGLATLRKGRENSKGSSEV
jgi:hypothetical protein